MASQTEVLKALHEKEGPIKSPDLAKELKTSDDTLILAPRDTEKQGIPKIRRSGNKPVYLLWLEVAFYVAYRSNLCHPHPPPCLRD